jgi:hypothetical protein
VTLEEINKEAEWKEKSRNENSQTIQPWEGERWVTDAKRGGGWGMVGWVDGESHYCKRETKAEAEAER